MKKGATLAQSDMAHVWRVVKLRKRRQLCWFHCSLDTALTYLHQKTPIRDDFYGCRSCGLAPRRRLHTGHPPARCPATLKSPATARRRRRCGGRQGSRECLSQLARKSQSRLGFPPIMSALARTARQNGCTSADSWWKIGFPQNDEALYRLFARSARFCPPAR